MCGLQLNYMINNLTKECNFDAVNLSITRTYSAKLFINLYLLGL